MEPQTPHKNPTPQHAHGHMWLVGTLGVVAGLVLAVTQASRDDGGGMRRVWSEEHGHYHDVR